VSLFLKDGIDCHGLPYSFQLKKDGIDETISKSATISLGAKFHLWRYATVQA
jgi:hypothetical protein